MLSTLVLAGCGFIFWIVISKSFPVHDVGLATSVLAALTLISHISLLGFDVLFIRLASRNEAPHRIINSALVTFLVASVLFVAYIVVFGNQIALTTDLFTGSFALLLFFVIALTGNSLLESFLIGKQAGHYILVKNSFVGVTRIAMAFGVSAAGFLAVVSASLLPVGVAFVMLSIFVIRKYHMLRSYTRGKLMDQTFDKFNLSNYAANIFNGLPVLLLPIIVAHKLGAPSAAYLYIDMLFLNLFNIIPMAISQSLFAHNSKDTKDKAVSAWRAIALMYGILIPAVACLIVFGETILAVFGKEYSNQGVELLRLFAFSTIFSSVHYLAIAKLNLAQRSGSVASVSLVSNLLFLVIVFISTGYGLMQVGYGWVLGNAVVAAIFLWVAFIKPAKKLPRVGERV